MPGPFAFAFRPRWWGCALAAAGCAAGVALGNWQSGRAEEKRAARAGVERVALSGEFMPEFTVYLDHKVHRGRPGYHVVQPLRPAAGGAHVLVNRGWIAAGSRRGDLPEVRTPAGAVAIEGVKLDRFPRAWAPAGAGPEGRVWQNVTREDFAAWSGLALAPFVLEQHSALEDGLARDWPAPDLGLEKHLAYALQWYSLAALSVVLFVVLSFRRDAPPAG